MRKLLVAHRGDCSRAHENTLEAFADAIANGADMIELDVRRTRDGEIVVHHDEAIANVLLREVDYNEVQQLAAALSYRVPTLAEVAALANGRIQLDVELKEPIGAATLDVLFRSGLAPGDVAVTSFDAAALRPVIDHTPSVRTGLLTEQGTEVFPEFRRSGTAFLAPALAVIDASLLSRADAEAIPLLPWTVNDLTDIERLLSAPPVIGVITDRLTAAVQLRASRAIRPILL